MRRLRIGCLLLFSVAAQAQFGQGTGDWSTSGGDAHRSSWVPADPKISPEKMAKPGFQFLWKMKLENSDSVTTPVLLNGYIGYKGFRSLAYVGGGSDTVSAMDTDLDRMEWQKHFPTDAASHPSPGSAACPGGMTANVTHSVGIAFPTAPAARGPVGGGRGARSAVGEPDQGAAILATFEERMRREMAAPPPATPSGLARSAPVPSVRAPNVVYALSSDGMLHAMYVSNGEESNPPVRFLPPNANASALTVTGGFAYVVTTRGCGGVENGIWALDLASKQVFSWASKDTEIVGTVGPAFGADGVLYVANTDGSLLALDSKTLVPKDSYTVKEQAPRSFGAHSFTSSPVVFVYKDRTLIAVTTQDGRIHLLDAANLGGADHQTPLHVTPPAPVPIVFPTGALATWAQSDGTRWLLSPTPRAILSWKVVEKDGAFSLQSAWTSEMSAPLVPMVINGVVFAASGGPGAVLHALDGVTGKELWNSGATITTPVRGGTLSGGGSQLYLATQDGTLYVFGYPIEH